MCSTHRNDDTWINCCVMNCPSTNRCYNNKCNGKCGGQWAGDDVSCYNAIDDGVSVDTIDGGELYVNDHWSVEYDRNVNKYVMKDWGYLIPQDEEEKLREMALSLAAKLKWTLPEEEWPASIYEVLDKVRKM